MSTSYSHGLGRVPLTLVAALLSVLASGAFVGCGQAEPVDSAPRGTGPTTPQALAYLASLYVGPPETAGVDTDAVEEFRSGGVGAELVYRSGVASDGESLVVAVGRGLDRGLVSCEAALSRSLAGCEVTDRGTVTWEAAVPEEDPGVVYVVVSKGEATVLLFYSGPPIAADPRTLDLPVSVDDLLDLANDPLVDVTTSAEAIAEGERLESWSPATGS